MTTETTTPQSTEGSGSTGNATSSGGDPSFSMEEYRSMQEQLRSANHQISNLAQSAKTVEKLQKVFAPEEMPADPDENFLDTYLQAAVDAEKNGTPIPLTTNLAVKLIESRKQFQEMQKRLSGVEDTVKASQDPAQASDRNAYASIDATLEQHLSEMYGEAGYTPQMMTATANMIVEEIKHLKQANPAAWDAIKRNPQNQKLMVQHFVEKAVPPAAKQAMQREYLQNYKMGNPELLQAFREASQIEDRAARTKVKESIRQQLLANIWSDKKAGSTISKLYR